MDQLIERVLSIGAGLAPIDRARVIADAAASQCHMLAVALHRQLLEIGGEALQVLLVWKDAEGLGTEKVIVPNCEQTHHDREIAIEGGSTEVLVDFMRTGEHRHEVLRTDRNHRRQPDRRFHGVTTAYPVPEGKHVGGIDTEFCDFLGIRRGGNKVLGDGALVMYQAS